MRKPDSEKLGSPIPDDSTKEKYIGETEKNLAVELDKNLSVVIKPWWKRLLRR